MDCRLLFEAKGGVCSRSTILIGLQNDWHAISIVGGVAAASTRVSHSFSLQFSLAPSSPTFIPNKIPRKNLASAWRTLDQSPLPLASCFPVARSAVYCKIVSGAEFQKPGHVDPLSLPRTGNSRRSFFGIVLSRNPIRKARGMHQLVKL